MIGPIFRLQTVGSSIVVTEPLPLTSYVNNLAFGHTPSIRISIRESYARMAAVQTAARPNFKAE